MGGSSAQSITHAGMSAATNTVTLVSQDFTSSSTGNVTLTSSSSSFYQIKTGTDSQVWEIQSSATSDNGSCSGCSGKRARVDEGGIGNPQNNTFVTKQFSPTTTSLAISFNWGFKSYTSDYFKVYLYNETDGAALSNLVYVSTTTSNQSYSAATTLSGSNSVNDNYSLRFQHVAEFDYGAQFDNILITEDVTNSGIHARNLTIDNSTAITLSSDYKVNGTLSITSGSRGLKTGANTLTIDPAGSMTRGAKSHYGGKSSGGKAAYGAPCECVEGNVMQKASTAGETIYYNVGHVDDQVYAPVWVKPTGTTDNFKVKFYNSVYGTLTTDASLDHVDQGMYWDVSRRNDADNANGSTDNALIALDWSSSDGVDTPSDIRLAHWNGSEWEAVTTNHDVGTTSSIAGAIPFSSGSAASSSGGSVSATASSFSPFTLGSTSSNNPLPVDLVSFDGDCKKSEVELEFVVAAQINNDYFTIERSSNNEDWTIVGEIAGAGNTSTQMSYNWTDYNALGGVSYYQLTQTDFDGKSKTFAPISVSCNDTDIDNYSIYPNPAKDELMIDIDLDNYQGDDVALQFIDINGRVVMQEKVVLERGFNHLDVQIGELPNGVYLLQFTGTRNHIKESRLIKQ
jgi:hypothetical protein